VTCHRVLTALLLCLSLSWTPAAQAQLDYVDSSSGLQTPAMEAGDTELEFGDVNGDGHVDIVSIGDHGSPYIGTSEHGIMVWFGDGSGAWSVYQSGDFGYGGIALGDVNGDGLMDAGYGMHHNYSDSDFGDQLLEVALGDGTGQNWTPWDDGLATSGETWGMFGTDFADVDNDGDLDLGSISFGCCAGVHVYVNNGDGTWTQSWGFTGGNADDIFQFGDINGDGFADFATAHGDGTVYLGDGTGSFILADSGLPGGAGVWRSGVSLGDVNNDGRDDLAYTTSNDGLTVWSYVSDGVWEDLSGTLPSSGEFRFTQIADMDLDGHGDLLGFAISEPGLIAVYGGDGAGNWEPIASVNTPDNCDVAAFRAGVDADHNGYPDITLVQEENCGYTGGTNRPRFYRETTTPSVTWIQAKYPYGGEVFHAGSVRFVEWNAAVAEGQPTVDIDLSLDGPEGPWLPIASSLPNNGRFQWHLPVQRTDASECHLRYTLGTETATTPAPFTILGELGLSALIITFPDGVPEYIPPSIPTDITVQIEDGSEAYVPGSGMLHYRYADGDFLTSALTPLGGTLYQAALPAPSCDDTPEFYISAEGDGGTTVYSPAGVPASVYTAAVATVTVIMDDDFETDQGWAVDNDPSVTDGAWERGLPADDGVDGDPTSDFDGSGRCYLTANRPGNSDLDGGPTMLISPLLDLTGLGDPVLRYARWWANDDQDGDPFDVEVSNDGGDTWTLIERVTNIPPGWVEREIYWDDYITPLTGQMRVRFSAMDNPNNSKDEGGLDAVLVIDISCADSASGDFDGDGDVDLDDYAGFADCLSGPDVTPSPTLPGVTVQGCLDAFDWEQDGDVDLANFREFAVIFGGG
jgi:hypothetical protein